MVRLATGLIIASLAALAAGQSQSVVSIRSPSLPRTDASSSGETSTSVPRMGSSTASISGATASSATVTSRDGSTTTVAITSGTTTSSESVTTPNSSSGSADASVLTSTPTTTSLSGAPHAIDFRLDWLCAASGLALGAFWAF
ncbi:uncharacterized protein L969DRAFT_88094 [Mixia osmundae IAM 14324]|uniref:uncharacterized protein n=1 Tax=Mixia osmundae (strain CBS 9802 / IAM 14324 / JCM 22182 / KY 12970) TaxID=764103 RepID=UPI0004A55590|nr:uncharacterized protein L969DRAFT_88094 [Mixia osmundae IAM 14324]KEI38786.1 hypothetical protein L969DRAFT_88094 [Mixia osmundae IAM 14324]